MTQYQDRKAKGLCVRCGVRKALQSLVRCQPCQDYSLEWQKKNRGAAKEPGRCACGKKATKGWATCGHCREYHREYLKTRVKKLRDTDKCGRCGDAPVPGSSNCAECQKYYRTKYKKLKDQVFAAYGGYECKCCGETTPEFLQIDHVNDDGAAHRRVLGQRGLYQWLFRNGFPKGFQVLCSNCNLGKRFCGVCPHQKAAIPQCRSTS